MKLKSQTIVVGTLISSFTVSYPVSAVLIQWLPGFTGLPILIYYLVQFTLLLGNLIGLTALMAVRPSARGKPGEWMQKRATLWASKGEGVRITTIILGVITLLLVPQSLFVVEQVKVAVVPMVKDPSIILDLGLLDLTLYLFTLIYLMLGADTLQPFLTTLLNRER